MYGMYIHHPSEHTVKVISLISLVWSRKFEIRYGDLITSLLLILNINADDILTFRHTKESTKDREPLPKKSLALSSSS